MKTKTFFDINCSDLTVQTPTASAVEPVDQDFDSTPSSINSCSRRSLGVPWKADSALDVLNATKDANVPNWDGCDSDPVIQATFERALDFLNQLPNSLTSPSVSVDPDGCICFEWCTPSNQRISVAVGPDREVSFAAALIGSEFCGKGFIDSTFPYTLVAAVLNSEAN